MPIWLLKIWDDLRSSYWFIPTIMSAAAICLAVLTLWADARLGSEWVSSIQWVYSGGPEGARSLLSTVASSMVTVAGVVFSITIVALTLASSQFGPRLLRNFMRDLGNQVTLGTFIATFLYCLLVLRTVRSPDEGGGFVPHVSVTVAIALTVFSVGVLIYYIHHVSSSIQAPYVIAAVARDLNAAVDEMFPERIGKPARREDAEPQLPPDLDGRGDPVCADRGGYVQAVDPDALLAVSSDRDLVLKVLRRPGDFVIGGTHLVLAYPADRLDDHVSRRVRDAFILGSRRTDTQDAEFAVNQLVEVAVRALSPGINDPFTAVTCIDRLGEALAKLAEREMPSPYRTDDDGRVRVVGYPPSFADIADAALNMIRQYGRDSAAVTIRLLETIRVVAEHVTRDEDRAALERHAVMIERDSAPELADHLDRRDLHKRFEAATESILARRLRPKE